MLWKLSKQELIVSFPLLPRLAFFMTKKKKKSRLFPYLSAIEVQRLQADFLTSNTNKVTVR